MQGRRNDRWRPSPLSLMGIAACALALAGCEARPVAPFQNPDISVVPPEGTALGPAGLPETRRPVGGPLAPGGPVAFE